MPCQGSYNTYYLPLVSDFNYEQWTLNNEHNHDHDNDLEHDPDLEPNPAEDFLSFRIYLLRPELQFAGGNYRLLETQLRNCKDRILNETTMI